MAASGKLDLVRGDSHLAGNLLDGSLEGPLRIDEHDRPQASLGNVVAGARRRDVRLLATALAVGDTASRGKSLRIVSMRGKAFFQGWALTGTQCKAR